MSDGDTALDDLIETCRAMPQADAIFRTLIRAAREAADISPALTFLTREAEPGKLSAETRVQIAEFLDDLEETEAALSWLSGDAAEMRLATARLLVRMGNFEEAVPVYRSVIEEDRSLRDPALDEALLATAASGQGSGGAEVFSLSGEKIAVTPERRMPEVAERPRLFFSDVGGLEDVKKQISRKIILPFQKPNLFQRFRKKAGGGVLMYGPPGCGKTMLARATAGECGARFINVEIPEILDMYIGESEKRLARIFEEARSETPAVLFFDELEALAARRKFSHNSNSSAMVSTFLNEMDGYAAENAGVLILAATNVPWAIDPAFRRHGRFDRVIFVPPPDKVARGEILKSLLEGRPQESLNLDAVIARTSGFSGADLANVVETACDIAIEESLSTDGVEPIKQAHLAEALKEVKPSTTEWLSSARNYARYANEGGLYDEVMEFLNQHTK